MITFEPAAGRPQEDLGLGVAVRPQSQGAALDVAHLVVLAGVHRARRRARPPPPAPRCGRQTRQAVPRWSRAASTSEARCSARPSQSRIPSRCSVGAGSSSARWSSRRASGHRPRLRARPAPARGGTPPPRRHPNRATPRGAGRPRRGPPRWTRGSGPPGRAARRPSRPGAPPPPPRGAGDAGTRRDLRARTRWPPRVERPRPRRRPRRGAPARRRAAASTRHPGRPPPAPARSPWGRARPAARTSCVGARGCRRDAAPAGPRRAPGSKERSSSVT